MRCTISFFKGTISECVHTSFREIEICERGERQERDRECTYPFVGLCVHAGGAPLVSPAPPETSESSPLKTTSHSLSPGPGVWRERERESERDAERGRETNGKRYSVKMHIK